MTKLVEEKNWEIFLDHSYYHLWCVRNKQDKDFNSLQSFHFSNKEDAEKFLELVRKAF